MASIYLQIFITRETQTCPLQSAGWYGRQGLQTRMKWAENVCP